jgi:hypothetical protein
VKIDPEKAHQFEQDATRHDALEENLERSGYAEDHPLRANARRRARMARQLAAIHRTGERPGVVPDIVEVHAEMGAAERVADQWRAERTHPDRAALLHADMPHLARALDELCEVMPDARS